MFYVKWDDYFTLSSDRRAHRAEGIAKKKRMRFLRAELARKLQDFQAAKNMILSGT